VDKGFLDLGPFEPGIIEARSCLNSRSAVPPYRITPLARSAPRYRPGATARTPTSIPVRPYHVAASYAVIPDLWRNMSCERFARLLVTASIWSRAVESRPVRLAMAPPLRTGLLCDLFVVAGGELQPLIEDLHCLRRDLSAFRSRVPRRIPPRSARAPVSVAVSTCDQAILQTLFADARRSCPSVQVRLE